MFQIQWKQKEFLEDIEKKAHIILDELSKKSNVAINNKTNPLIDAEAGKRALEVVLAIYKSASENKPVKLPLDKCSTLDFVGRFDK